MRNEASSNVTSSVERIPLNFENLLINAAPSEKSVQSAITVLQKKSLKIQDNLKEICYTTEIDHVTGKIQFNIILIGAPRVGKSQLINAICNDENKAETSASLNSCTKEVKCYSLEDNQQQTPGIKPFRINFYDTPGIESWINEGGRTAMIKFIQDNDPICVIYCASPGSFADLEEIRPVIEFCRKKHIFWAFVCTNMWSNYARKHTMLEFEKELAIFGSGTEKLFEQPHSSGPHKVTMFGNSALCTMVNSIEYYDPELSPERKPVQGIDELIYCIMEALDDEKLIGWCNAVLYRRSFWEKLSQKTSGFISLRIKEMQNMNTKPVQNVAIAVLDYISRIIKKKSSVNS